MKKHNEDEAKLRYLNNRRFDFAILWMGIGLLSFGLIALVWLALAGMK